MAETNTTPWLIAAPVEMTAECVGPARFAVTPYAEDDEYAGPTVSAIPVRQGRHRALRLEIPSQPTWRTLARALASV